MKICIDVQTLWDILNSYGLPYIPEMEEELLDYARGVETE